MTYENIRQGKFICRPNRFIAHVEIDGKTEICHVKNTGRCKELLIPGATVFLQEFYSGSRKTRFDLISLYKGSRLINMDSGAPNKVFAEWVKKAGLWGEIDLIKPEYRYNNSRLDFYIEADGKKILVEVKGVTLEENGIARFPDAPTVRGLKHVTELSRSVENGHDAYVVFIIQMSGVRYFTPNYKTHKEFGDALKTAWESGVNILALDCKIAEDSIIADNYVDIHLC